MSLDLATDLDGQVYCPGMDEGSSPYRLVALGVLATIGGTAIVMLALDTDAAIGVLIGYAVLVVGSVATLVGVIAAGVRYGMRLSFAERVQDTRHTDRLGAAAREAEARRARA